MSNILAYKTQHDLSLVVTTYASTMVIARRTFYLRNLEGSSIDSQTEHAIKIAEALAQEIYYITNFGLDKVAIKVGHKKVGEIVFDMKPKIENSRGFYYAVKFTFFNAFTYKWVKEGEQQRWNIPETMIDEDWHRSLVDRQKKQSFNLPCLIGKLSATQKQTQSFFHFGHWLSNRRKRRPTRFSLAFNNEDPTYQSFLSRFYIDGNLCLGNKRVFAADHKFDDVVGINYPFPKAKSKPFRHKSRLASQPNDDTDYVYIIQMGRKNIFKIGKSNDPQARLTTLQTSSPYELKIFHIFEADNASAAEESLHMAFSAARMEGEWFNLTNLQKSQVAEIKGFEDGKFTLGERHITAKELEQA